MSPAERQRRYHQVIALGNSGSTTQTEVHLGIQLLASPEVDEDDDLYQEDPRIVEAHSRLDVLTEYLGSIPGFEEYCTTLEDETLEDVDSNDLEEEINSEIDDVHVQTSLMITFRPVLMIKLRTVSTYTRGFV